MSELDKYMKDILAIVSEYRRIEEKMKLLLEKTNLLNEQKKEIELELLKNREKERSLMKMIKAETGNLPNFVEILERINN